MPPGKLGGVSHGLSHAGYDLRIAEDLTLVPGQFSLASTLERLKLPDNVVGFIHGKSTWARSGMLVHNTVAEPGWEGYLTLELFNHGSKVLELRKGMGVVQILFCFLDEPTYAPYEGKYQNQKAGPQPAIFEEQVERALPRAKFKKIPECQVGVGYSAVGYGTCGEPSTWVVSWNDDELDSMHVCDTHAEAIEFEEARDAQEQYTAEAASKAMEEAKAKSDAHAFEDPPR